MSCKQKSEGQSLCPPLDCPSSIDLLLLYLLRYKLYSNITLNCISCTFLPYQCLKSDQTNLGLFSWQQVTCICLTMPDETHFTNCIGVQNSTNPLNAYCSFTLDSIFMYNLHVYFFIQWVLLDALGISFVHFHRDRLVALEVGGLKRMKIKVNGP